MADFSWRVRIYWEDTDAGGVVYYANYLRFLERARTEWLRDRGIDQSRLHEQSGAVLVVRSVHCDFLAPARLDDELDIEVALVSAGGARLVMDQRIVRCSDGQPLIEARVTAACLDAANWRPRRLPPALKDTIAR